MRARAWRSAAIVAATSLTLLMAAPPASAAPFFTSVPLMITLADPSTSKATRIISVGDEVGEVTPSSKACPTGSARCPARVGVSRCS